MKIFFVRHGESELNAQGFHQFKTTPLSERGRDQSEKVALRLKQIPIDYIFASTFSRASQTAEIIASYLQKEVTFSDVFGEIKRPSEIEGKHTLAPEVVNIKEAIFQHYHDKDWHYSDEENFHDFRARSEQAWEMIEEPNFENVLVVTHGDLMRMMLAVKLFGDSLNSHTFLALTKGLDIKNTGITMMKKNLDGWRQITWNDFSHIEGW